MKTYCPFSSLCFMYPATCFSFTLRPRQKIKRPSKGAIVTIYNRSIPFREIAQQINCSRNTVITWIRRFEETASVIRKFESGIVKKKLPCLRHYTVNAAKPIKQFKNLKANKLL